MAIRYMKLENPVGNGWVVRIKIGWQEYKEVEKDGIVTRVKGERSGVWEKKGYDDICIASERTIDLRDTGIPDKSEVWLKPFVALGKDGPDSEHFIYDKDAGDTAAFKITGALCGKKELEKI